MFAKSTSKINSLIFHSTTNSAAADKKKSAVISLVLFLGLLFLLYFINFWPPTNTAELVDSGGGGGLTVNFGDTDLGSGADITSKELEVTKTNKTTKLASQDIEDLTTDKNSDTEVALTSKKNSIKKNQLEPTKKTILAIETKKSVVKKTDDALANLLKGNSKGGDGNSKTSGNQGRSNGDINATGYSGAGGSGGGNGGGSGNGNGSGVGSGSGSTNGSGYSLGNRRALSKPEPNYTCTEEGKVVVEITVDQSGRVIAAKPGVKGTTNTAACLLSQAKIAALNTKWEASNEAPNSQIGKIIYNFSLN